MRCLLFLGVVALTGCGHVGAAVVRTVPEEYHWIGFVIAALTFAIWSYGIWRQEYRLQREHWFLIPLIGFSLFFSIAI